MASSKRHLGNQLMTLQEKRGVHAYAPDGVTIVRVGNVSPFQSKEWRRKRTGIAEGVARRAAENRKKSAARRAAKKAIVI